MSASVSEGASLQIHGAIASIVFDQKRTHNSLRLRTWMALPALIAAADRDSSVGLILLRGAHGNFGTGNDLMELRALHGKLAAAQEFARAVADATQAVEAASKPVVVAIEGLCYGASVALALAGDLRIAATNATFAITPAKLGALYLQSDLHRLVAAVGVGQSKMMMFSAQPISAARARDIGLVDELISAGQFESELKQWTDTLLRGSPFTLRQTKQMLRSVQGVSTPLETDESLAAFIDATQGDEFVEGVDAFLAKRLPLFR